MDIVELVSITDAHFTAVLRLPYVLEQNDTYGEAEFLTVRSWLPASSPGRTQRSHSSVGGEYKRKGNRP